MDFNLTREQELIRKMMKDFTENEVKPIAAETDKTCQYPRENIEKLFNLGIMQDSECIIAVNKNDTAPIFEIADYGICGDLFKVTPLLTQAIRDAKAAK